MRRVSLRRLGYIIGSRLGGKRETRIVCVLQYLRMPLAPPFRPPTPEVFHPENGARNSAELETASLTQQLPASTRRAIASPRERSPVKTLALSP